jgi:hypothetical protein
MGSDDVIIIIYCWLSTSLRLAVMLFHVNLNFPSPYSALIAKKKDQSRYNFGNLNFVMKRVGGVCLCI